MYVYCVESFAHIECYSDCSRRGSHLEHLSSSSAELQNCCSEDQPDQSKAEEFTCSLYGMKGYVKDVNEARHVKLCQMTENG